MYNLFQSFSQLPGDLRTSITAEESIYFLLSQLPRLNHDTFRSIMQAFYMSVEFGTLIYTLVLQWGCDSLESITSVFGPAFFRNNGIKDSDSVILLTVFIEKYINFFQKVEVQWTDLKISQKRPWDYKIGRFRDLVNPDEVPELPTDANSQLSALLVLNAVDNLFQNASKSPSKITLYPSRLNGVILWVEPRWLLCLDNFASLLSCFKLQIKTRIWFGLRARRKLYWRVDWKRKREEEIHYRWRYYWPLNSMLTGLQKTERRQIRAKRKNLRR